MSRQPPLPSGERVGVRGSCALRLPAARTRGRGDTQNPTFLALHLLALFIVERGIAGEKRRQLARIIECSEVLRGSPYLGRVLHLATERRNLEERGINLGENDAGGILSC